MKFDRSSIIDVLLFFFTLACAWYFQWSSGDLVWSLWVSSLIVGYITLIFGPLILGITKIPWRAVRKDFSLKDFIQELKSQPKKKLFPAIALLVALAIFFVAFFTIHFGMFHFIHGSFLSSFFPLEDMKYPNSPWDLPGFAVRLAIKHWPFVLASAVSQFFRLDSKSDEPGKSSDIFFGPYKSVIRMHIMIFVFAFLHMAKADNFVFYTVILFAYFFPWRVLRKEPVKPEDQTIGELLKK